MSQTDNGDGAAQQIIPILLYHGVNSDPSDRLAHYTVTPEVFAQHLDLLVEGNFRCLQVSQYLDEVADGTFQEKNAGRRVALVTFDDGWADFAEHAVPAMLQHNIESTLYVTTGFIGGGFTDGVFLPKEPMMHWSQIPDLPQAGVEIGAHSHSHPQMDTLLPGRAWDELTRSKALLEDSLGTEVRSFAYPHGYNSARLREQTKRAGYDSAAAVRNLLSHTKDDLFRIARLTITDDTSLNDIESWLCCEGAGVATPNEQPKTRLWRTYRYGKAIVTNKVGTDYK